MKKFGVVVLWLWAVVLYSQVNDQPYIEVNGSTELEIIPNEIYVGFTLSEFKNEKRVESLEKLEQGLLDSLKKLGVPQEDLKVSDFAGLQNYRRRSRDEINSTRTYQLKLSSLEKVLSVEKVLESLSCKNYEIEKVDHSDIESLRLEVKVKAAKEAKSKAKLLCDAIDETLGKALVIREVKNYQDFRRLEMSASNRSNKLYEDSASELEYKSPLSVEPIVLKYEVYIKFQLE